MNITIGKRDGLDFTVDLDRLISTRLLIQANSGGGKSYLIRKILEESHGKVQHIVLDLEGEFSTMRSKYDYILAGKDGDIDVNVKNVPVLIKRILQYNISIIIDLYELKHHERIVYVRKFLESMINVKKELWKPCLVIIDEAHIFCPEKAKAESGAAVIDLCTRGRKRGFCAVLATQRLSKLNKDAAAECNNKLIGRTGLDVDMKRASDELGFTSKQQIMELRNLDAGNFYAFGPAISRSVKNVWIDSVKTEHPQGEIRKLHSYKNPPLTDNLKKKLAKLSDVAETADKELMEIEDFKKEISRLRMELRRLQKGGTETDDAKLKPMMVTIKELKEDNSNLLKQIEVIQKNIETKEKATLTHLDNFRNFIKDQKTKIPEIKFRRQPAIEFLNTKSNFQGIPKNDSKSVNNSTIRGGAKRMLQAIASFHPDALSKQQVGAIAGLSFKSGTFNTYLSALKTNNLISEESGGFVVTESGIDEAGDTSTIPNDLNGIITMWSGKVKGGASRMLLTIYEKYPDELSKEDLGTSVGITHTSGTFNTYLSKLRGLGLIRVERQMVSLDKEFANKYAE
jgi:hypothetical protein